MRLFVALELPAPVREALELAVDGLRETSRVRWVRPRTQHVTLVFMGETSADTLPSVTQSLDEAAWSLKPFTLHVEGTGTFGIPPRVMWLGVGGDLELARAAQREVERCLSVVPERDVWAPHVTMARSRKPKGDSALADLAKIFSIPDVARSPFTVSELVLFESLNGEHQVRHRARFASRRSEL